MQDLTDKAKTVADTKGVTIQVPGSPICFHWDLTRGAVCSTPPETILVIC